MTKETKKTYDQAMGTPVLEQVYGKKRLMLLGNTVRAIWE